MLNHLFHEFHEHQPEPMGRHYQEFQQIPHGMTPVYANIPKRWRHFADDPTYGTGT
jgi:hypothetical protein